MASEPQSDLFCAISDIIIDFDIREVKNRPTFGVQFGITDCIGFGSVPIHTIAFNDKLGGRYGEIWPKAGNTISGNGINAYRGQGVLHFDFDTASEIRPRHLVVRMLFRILGIEGTFRRSGFGGNFRARHGIVDFLERRYLRSHIGALGRIIFPTEVISRHRVFHEIRSKFTTIIRILPLVRDSVAHGFHINPMSLTERSECTEGDTPHLGEGRSSVLFGKVSETNRKRKAHSLKFFDSSLVGVQRIEAATGRIFLHSMVQSLSATPWAVCAAPGLFVTPIIAFVRKWTQ